jgi:ABC-type transport system involved in cytochrome c biogenesis permease subunit
VRLGWLVAHISALMAAYAALGFSLLASVLYLLRERRLKSRRKPSEAPQRLSLDWLPPLDSLERIARFTLEFGFLCMTVGLIIGAVLAQETYGTAYFRDPKIILSFVLWAAYVALLLLRRAAGLRGRRAAWLGGVVFLVMLGVLAANLFSHVHGYGLR